MRSLTDTIATGPYVSPTHRAAVEATAVDLSHKPVGSSLAAISGPQQQLHAGSGNAAQRASYGRYETMVRADGSLLQQLLKAQVDRTEADRLWEGDGESSDRTEEAQLRLDRLTAAVLDRMQASYLPKAYTQGAER